MYRKLLCVYISHILVNMLYSKMYSGVDNSFIIDNVDKDIIELDVGDITDTTEDMPKNFIPPKKKKKTFSYSDTNTGKEGGVPKNRSPASTLPTKTHADAAYSLNFVHLKQKFCERKGVDEAGVLAKKWGSMMGNTHINANLSVLNNCTMVATGIGQHGQQQIDFLLKMEEVLYLESNGMKQYPKKMD
eukprot:GHVR01096243.1.p1 GENE.GHVR01096243.1~~GHVR01096243.1.p1  ORF type:complete len:188 (-),score=42.92 GHVR01096243.1:276-839(-)